MIRSSKHHLADAGETYSEHLIAALGFSARLVKAGAACALHAIVPALCARTASRSIAELHSTLAMRAAFRRIGTAETAASQWGDERSDDHRFRIDA